MSGHKPIAVANSRTRGSITPPVRRTRRTAPRLLAIHGFPAACARWRAISPLKPQAARAFRVGRETDREIRTAEVNAIVLQEGCSPYVASPQPARSSAVSATRLCRKHRRYSETLPRKGDAGAVPASVVSVHRHDTHSFSKPAVDDIQLIEGIGLVGDAHAGITVQHRSRVSRDSHAATQRRRLGREACRCHERRVSRRFGPGGRRDQCRATSSTALPVDRGLGEAPTQSTGGSTGSSRMRPIVVTPMVCMAWLLSR